MPNPAIQRFKVWALFAFMLLGGGGIVWLSLADIVDAVHRTTRGAPLVQWSSMDVRGLFAGLALLTLAPLCVPIREAPPTRRRHRREPARRIDPPAILMGAALVCTLLCVAAPPIATIAMGEFASGHGYRLCPDPADEHRPPFRWSRPAPAGRCPASWEEAERMMR